MRKKIEKKTVKKAPKKAATPKKAEAAPKKAAPVKKAAPNKPAATKKFSPKQLDHYRQLLVEKRHEIQGVVSVMEENIFQSGGDISSMPVHLADIGTDSYEQEFSLGLMAEEKKILLEIHKALDRIANGTYGICEGLDIPIESNRLEAIPWTRFSMEYARMVETQDPRLETFKRRPIDIEREDESDSDDEAETETEEAAEKIEFDDSMESLDEIEEEDSDYEGDDLDRQRDSA